MEKAEFIFHQIGIIHSPHKEPTQTPIQPVFAKGIQGTVELFSEYTDALQDLEAFSHIFLLYYFDRSGKTRLKVKPFLEDKLHGIFATRAPNRPNKIGFSVVRLLKIAGNILEIDDVDILDQTPLLDIKPYVTRFDMRPDARCGWQDGISDEEAAKRGKRDYQPQAGF